MPKHKGNGQVRLHLHSSPLHKSLPQPLASSRTGIQRYFITKDTSLRRNSKVEHVRKRRCPPHVETVTLWLSSYTHPDLQQSVSHAIGLANGHQRQSLIPSSVSSSFPSLAIHWLPPSLHAAPTLALALRLWQLVSESQADKKSPLRGTWASPSATLCQAIYSPVREGLKPAISLNHMQMGILRVSAMS